MNIPQVLALEVDDTFKGIPGGTAPFALAAMGDRGWNILRGTVPLPIALLKQSALVHNSDWMRRFVALTGVKLAPHGKTTMSPQLFERQLQDGAWAITLATIGQVHIARRYGLSRVFLANELVGTTEIRWVLDELARDPGFDFYCLADSVGGVERLAAGAREAKVGRPLQVLVERGFPGGRAGCRSVDEALAVARAVHQAGPALALRGVEGFEGILGDPEDAGIAARVRAFLESMVETARRAAAEDLFAPGPVILTAGGSAFFDLVVQAFGGADIGRDVAVILRSGCYVTQDTRHYEEAFRRIAKRNGTVREMGPGLANAIELWSYVLSRPEPTRAILGFGKRDTGTDAGLPRPLLWFRPGHHGAPVALGGDHAIVTLNDQHAFLDLPADSPMAVGDMIGAGISHPCTTFDKWRLLPVVDDDYNVVDGIRTFF
jgi:D-serine dehydratase